MRAAAGLVALMLSVGLASADEACPKQDGMIQGPVVPTKQAARDIYIAVAKAHDPRTWRKHREIFVLDEGATWGVGQRAPMSIKTWKNAHGQAMETISGSAGGGGLDMSIDKCTGAVAMHYSR